MHRQIAGKLTGPVTKWLVLVAWIVIMGAASGFAEKLAEVQDNEAASWLPASAESTKALEKLAPFQDSNDIPTALVYVRDGGLTTADLTAIKAQVGEIEALDGASSASDQVEALVKRQENLKKELAVNPLASWLSELGVPT